MFWLGKSIESDVNSGGKIVSSISLSPIEVIILAQLRSRELRNAGSQVGQYGYEMIQALNVLFAGSWEAKSGTIYPILSKLEGKKKLLIGVRKKSPLGPVKKVYNLTQLGRDCIDKVISENIQSDIDFILHFFNLLTPFVQYEKDDAKSDEIFEKLMALPSKGAAMAMDGTITEVDKQIRKKKMLALKNKLEVVLNNLEKALNQP
jgi:PadR family transcriptional regulator